MQALVTNKNNDYEYVIENVTTVNFVERTIIIVSIDGVCGVATHTYNSDETIISII